ncbi:MAG TPA: histidine phosphatase family protein, partial [Burkholderiaceae bacterium]|nr:histidine phosphatase family protein [Burkholderiaceae bacterium]
MTGPAVAQLVLVRHGETAWNRDRRIQEAFEPGCNRIDMAGRGQVQRSMRPPGSVEPAGSSTILR